MLQISNEFSHKKSINFRQIHVTLLNKFQYISKYADLAFFVSNDFQALLLIIIL